MVRVIPQKVLFQKNAILSFGRTKLLFGQTFSSHQDLLEVFSSEQNGELFIAVYVRDHHILISRSNDTLFVNPSYMYRFPMRMFVPAKRCVSYPIKQLTTENEARHINRIYRECSMVEQPVATMLHNQRQGKVCYYVAHNKQGEVIGTVTAVDHVEVFHDPRQGASIWQLAVGEGYRCKGVGKALVKQVLEHFLLLGRKFVDLSVMYNNKRAMDFYRRIGFKRKNFFIVKKKNELNRQLYLGTT